jgi:hypothetical protein
MHTRDYVKAVFANEGLYCVKNAKMKEFLDSIDKQKADCWPEFIKQFREQYYDLFDDVIPPLLYGKDRLVRSIIIRAIDTEQKKEMNIAKEFVRKADGVTHEKDLLALTSKKNKTLNKEILKKPHLTKLVLSQITLDEKIAVTSTPETKTKLSKQ